MAETELSDRLLLLRLAQERQVEANGRLSIMLADALNINGHISIANKTYPLVFPTLGNKFEQRIEEPRLGYVQSNSAAPVPPDQVHLVVVDRTRLPVFEHVDVLDERMQLVHQNTIEQHLARQEMANKLMLDTFYSIEARDMILAQGEVRSPVLLQAGKQIHVTARGVGISVKLPPIDCAKVLSKFKVECQERAQIVKQGAPADWYVYHGYVVSIGPVQIRLVNHKEKIHFLGIAFPVVVSAVACEEIKRRVVEENGECPICMENMPWHKWMCATCNHAVCRACWSGLKGVCPMCRSPETRV